MSGQVKFFILKCFSLALIFGFLISCGSSPGTAGSGSTSPSQQPIDAQARQDLYMRHIRNEGYAPSIDEDGDIAFRRGGLNYYVIINRRDPSFTIVLLPVIVELYSDSDRARAASAVSYANSRTKVAKAYLTGQNDQYVSIAVEIYLENPNDFEVLFNRFLGAIGSSKEDFESRM